MRRTSRSANAAARSSGVPLPKGGEAPTDDLPREQTLILQNPEGAINNPGWFNIWVNAGGGLSTGLHQLMMDTLWFIDPNAGIEGVVHNALATGPAEYNDDFSEMTVHLRDDIYWSDGEQFTADDVVFTVQTQMDTPGMNWSGAFSTQVATVEAVDAQTVHFTLQAPNSRFHSIFSVRWNAAWIMPEHIFSGVENVLEYDFANPVGLGPYVLHSFDPNGTWYIWEKREDWDRTSVADFGEPAPQYVIYRNNMPIDNRLIEMRNGDLDMIHDLSPEGMFSIVEEEDTVRGYFPGFPYAHPDPTLPMFIFNHQNEKFQDRRVRWALALMLDARGMSMASYRGAATLSAISIPPTGTHPDDYHIPMQEELINFELDTGESVIKPYNPDIGLDVAELVRPEFGDEVPTDEDAIRRAFGYGWWSQNLDAAAELLRSCRLHGGRWWMDDAQRRAVRVHPDGAGRGRHQPAGHDRGPDVEPGRRPRDRRSDGTLGQCLGSTGSRRLRGQCRVVRGDVGRSPRPLVLPRQLPLQLHRGARRAPAGAQLDALGEPRARSDHRGDPHRLVRRPRAQRGARPQFVRLHLQEMPNIPVMSYNVFVAMSERYWTGYPTSENPYANPVNNWANSRYILTQLTPVGG